ncbi:MAG: hypothetical protein HY066_02840 [Betaproteobacteria bacterium]|nr:hypothetical protein [Betaproteobacteria bacterium]
MSATDSSVAAIEIAVHGGADFMAHGRQEGALGVVRRIGGFFRLAQLLFRLLALGYVGKCEDPAEHAIFHQLRTRAALDGAIISEFESIQRVRLIADEQPQKAPPAFEANGHLPQQVAQDGAVVATVQHLVFDTPDGGKATIEIDDPLIQIEHQYAFRRRLQGSGKQRAGFGQLSVGALTGMGVARTYRQQRSFRRIRHPHRFVH